MFRPHLNPLPEGEEDASAPGEGKLSKRAEDYCRSCIRAIRVSAIVAGVSATAIPAVLSAAIFPAAVPWPPDTIAPAWPMRRPGGAVRPAMNAATGFLRLFLIQ